jgi:hypothetical protein
MTRFLAEEFDADLSPSIASFETRSFATLLRTRLSVCNCVEILILNWRNQR